jgi:hypothetical protein
MRLFAVVSIATGMLAIGVCQASSLQTVTDQGLACLRNHEYDKAISVLLRVPTEKLRNNADARDAVFAKELLASAYIEKGNYRTAMSICKQVHGSTSDQNLIQIADNLRDKARARESFRNGITSVDGIYRLSQNNSVAFHYLDFALMQPGGDMRFQDMLRQLSVYVSHSGYSPNAAWLIAELCAKYKTGSLTVFDTLLKRQPGLQNDCAFLLDYGSAIQTNKPSAAMRCWAKVIRQTKSNRQRAMALLDRSYLHVKLKMFGEAKKDVSDCKAIVDRYHIRSMESMVGSQLRNVNVMLAAEQQYNAESEDLTKGRKGEDAYIPYVCFLIAVVVVAYRLRTFLLTR